MDYSGNDISVYQNDPRFMRFLRARSQFYKKAEQYQKAQIIFSVVLPIILSVFGLIHEDARSWVALYSLIIAVTDVAWLDRSMRSRIKLASKVSEQFDCELLQIPQNKSISGDYLLPEDIEDASNSWKGGEDNLYNWYADNISEAPLGLARIICQRSNTWYDRRLRQQYGGWLLAFVSIVFLAIFIVGALYNIKFRELVATVFSPAAPALIWSLREYFRQIDIVGIADATMKEAERLSDKISRENCTDEECIAWSRELQNSIYLRRANSPLIFPSFYSFKRAGMENLMKKGALEILEKIKKNNNDS